MDHALLGYKEALVESRLSRYVNCTPGIGSVGESMNGDCTDTKSARVTTQCIRQREAYDPCDNFRVDVDFISGGGKYSLGEVDSEGWSARQAKPKGSDDMKNAGSHSLNTKWKKKFSVKHNRYYWHDGKVSVWKIPTVEEGGQTETLKKVVPPSSGQDILSESKEGTAQGRMICCNGTGKYLRDETTNKERMFTNQVVNYEQHVEKEKGLRVMDSNIKERYHSCVTTVKYLNAPFTSPIKVHFIAVDYNCLYILMHKYRRCVYRTSLI